MIVLSNTTAQTLIPGQAITFDEDILHSGTAECWRRKSSAVKLRSTGVYAVVFSGNIGGVAAGAAQLTIRLGEVDLPETTMITTTAAAGDLNHVSTETRVKNCCGDYDRITVVNTGTADITIGANAALVIERRS